MHRDAFAAYLQTGMPISRIGQTIGTCGASAGTHEKDGEFEGHDYTVCTDIRVRDLSYDAARDWLRIFWAHGFAGWFRCAAFPEDHWPGVTHLHIIWPAAPMKEICRHQVHDFCATPSKTGLASHLTYHFAQPTEAQRQVVRAGFLAHNPVED